MKVLLLVLSMSAPAAFAGTENADAEFLVSRTQLPKSLITWKTSSDVMQACNKENRRLGFAEFVESIEACSFWNGASCLIITKPKTTMHIIGHEMRHCFQKHWH
jgi:hypothetical protein